MKKPSAAARTVDMFTSSTQVEKVEAAVEEVKDDERADFQPMDARADEYREKSFKCQEWTTKYFGNPNEGDSDEYRMTKKGDTYCLEQLKRSPEGKSFYGYASLMVPAKNLIPMATVIAAAAREYAKGLKK